MLIKIKALFKLKTCNVKNKNLGMVAYTCDPSYSGGKSRRNRSSRFTQAKVR
jgi:hypothetical protein